MLKDWAKKLKDQVVILFLAFKHSDTPMYAKILIALILGYVLSPIDFIPDFIPLIGYLDEMILLPLAISVVHG